MSITITPDEAVHLDPVTDYLRALGKTALLSAEEEVDLSKRREAGLEAERRLADPSTNPDHQHALRRIAADGHAATDRLARANLRLVVSIAKKHYTNHNMTMLDLIQEGNLGLLRAVEKFDYRRGYKFSTYATWWIRQAIQRGTADKSRTVRLPVAVFDAVRKMAAARRDLASELGRDPTDAEVAELVGETPERIAELSIYDMTIASLNTPVGDDEGSAELGDMMEDPESEDGYAAALDALGMESLLRLIELLPERERVVIELRFGLRGDSPGTYEVVGNALGVSRERIRQIESKALARLRNPMLSGQLRAALLPVEDDEENLLAVSA